MAMHQQNLNEVDKLLQKMELENKQQTRPIQAERQKSLTYQQQLNDTMERIRELEMSTSKLGARDKQLQLNFKAHKDKLESFKETVPVLEEHEEALKQKLQQTLMITQQQTTQQHSALQKYRDIWATYQAKYESSDKCKELLMAREKLNLLQRRDNDLQSQVQSLKNTIELLQQMEAESKEKLTKWVTQIAAHRSNTASTYIQLKSTWTAIAELRVQIEEKERQLKAASVEVTPVDTWDDNTAATSNVDQPTLHHQQLPIDQHHQASPPHHSQVMDTTQARERPLPQASVSLPQHQQTHKKPAPVTIPKLIYTPKRHLPADSSMLEPREGRLEGEGRAGAEKELQVHLPSVSVPESGPKTTSRFTFQIPQFNKPTTSSSAGCNQTTATTASRTIPSTLPPRQIVQQPNPPTITTPTQPTNTPNQLCISMPTRPQQEERRGGGNTITSASSIQSPGPRSVLLPQAGLTPNSGRQVISTQLPQLPPNLSIQDSNDDAVTESEEQAYHMSSQQQQEPVEALSVPEQQQQQFSPQPCQEDNNSFFSGVFGNQSLEPSYEQGSMWDAATTPFGTEGVPQQQPQSDLFSFSSSTNTSSAIDFGNLFGSTEGGGGGSSSSTSFFSFEPAPTTSTGSDFSLFGTGTSNNNENTGFQLSFDLPSNSSSTTGNTAFSLF